MSPSSYDPTNFDGTTDNVTITVDKKSCACTCTYPEPIEDNKPLYKIIGDMVYFKNINKAIPFRKLTKEMRKGLDI